MNIVWYVGIPGFWQHYIHNYIYGNHYVSLDSPLHLSLNTHDGSFSVTEIIRILRWEAE